MYKSIRGVPTYLTVTSLGTVINLFRNVLVANLLGPYVTGLCHTLLVIPQLGQYFNFGLNESRLVFTSKNEGEGEKDKVYEINNTVFNLTIITSIFAFIIAGIYITFFPLKYPGVRSYGILAALLIIIWEIKRFLLNQYIIENKIIKLSWIELTFVVTVFIVQLSLISISNQKYSWFSGGHAFWYGLIIPASCVVVYGLRDHINKIIVSLKIINLQYIRKMIPLGMILQTSAFVYMPFVIISRIILASSVGPQEVGYFLLSAIFISKFSTLPNSIAKILLPKFSFMYGEKKSFNHLYNLFIISQKLSFSLTLLLVLMGYFLLEPIVILILPDYTPGILPCKVMMIAAIPYSLIENANKLLLSLEYKRLYTWIYLISIMIFLLFLAILFGNNKISALNISWCVSLSFLFYSIILNYNIIRKRQLENNKS